MIQPIMRSVFHGGHQAETPLLDTKSFELLKEIQQELSVFEPIDDDEARMIWLEIPRGSAEEFKAWYDERFGCTEEEENNPRAYLEIIDEYPREIEWFFLTTSTYKENCGS